jgi:hypothetical protein
MYHGKGLDGMLNKLKNVFSKSKEVTKETAIGPWVKVIEVHFDKENPTQGYFELDWNEDFVGLLGEAGYAGETPEKIVDLWFNDLCRSVALDATGED